MLVTSKDNPKLTSQLKTSKFSSQMELIPGLPEDVALDCLLRLPPSSHRTACHVCHRWNSLIPSRAFYQERKRTAHTRNLACLLQVRPTPPINKPICPVSFRLTLFDPEHQTWEVLEPIPGYPNGVPLFCQLASVEGELVVMGGWDPATWKPLRTVWVHNFGGGGWRRGADMAQTRSLFAVAGGGDGRIYVAGGHDEEKNALRSAAAYNVMEDKWEAVAEMEEGRDECEGLMVGGEFWVVSGYATEAQGKFVETAEVYEIAAGRWRRKEGVWKEGRCVRGAVGVGRNGRVVNFAEEQAPPMAAAVVVGERVVVAGTAGFFIGELEGGKYERVEPPAEFLGSVQSGCCVVI